MANMNLGGAESRGRLMWLLCVVAATVSSSGLFASPLPCVVDTYAHYQAQGQCKLGDYILKGFTFASTGSPILLNAAQITVDPTPSTPTNLTLRFSTSGGFHVVPGQSQEYIFQFQLDPLLPTIAGPLIDLGPNDPVRLIGEFCGDGTLFSSPKSQPVFCLGSAPSGIFPARLELSGAGVPASQSYLFPSLVTMMDNRLILDLDGPANLDYFEWGAGVTDGNAIVIPEPSTSMAAFAMLALVWLPKRWRVRAARAAAVTAR